MRSTWVAVFVEPYSKLREQLKSKSNKDYSPTTMYNDYSINEALFHWQSQSISAFAR